MVLSIIDSGWKVKGKILPNWQTNLGLVEMNDFGIRLNNATDDSITITHKGKDLFNFKPKAQTVDDLENIVGIFDAEIKTKELLELIAGTKERIQEDLKKDGCISPFGRFLMRAVKKGGFYSSRLTGSAIRFGYEILQYDDQIVIVRLDEGIGPLFVAYKEYPPLYSSEFADSADCAYNKLAHNSDKEQIEEFIANNKV